jgi:hypothetical protein
MAYPLFIMQRAQAKHTLFDACENKSLPAFFLLKMDDIGQLIPFFQLRRIFARGILERSTSKANSMFDIQENSYAKNCLVYEDVNNTIGSIYKKLSTNQYVFFNQRVVIKLNLHDKSCFYNFTVFDLWNETEM